MSELKLLKQVVENQKYKPKKYDILVIDLVDSLPTQIIKAKISKDPKETKKAKNKFKETIKNALGELENDKISLHDWGGVIGEVEKKYKTPQLIKSLNEYNMVFSFTPWNKKNLLLDMANLASNAGFKKMIIMTKKEGDGGKEMTFSALKDIYPDKKFKYYEDTYSILKKLATSNTKNVELIYVINKSHPVDEKDKDKNTISDMEPEEYCSLYRNLTNNKEKVGGGGGEIVMDEATSAFLIKDGLPSIKGKDHTFTMSAVMKYIKNTENIERHSRNESKDSFEVVKRKVNAWITEQKNAKTAKKEEEAKKKEEEAARIASLEPMKFKNTSGIPRYIIDEIIEAKKIREPEPIKTRNLKVNWVNLLDINFSQDTISRDVTKFFGKIDSKNGVTRGQCMGHFNETPQQVFMKYDENHRNVDMFMLGYYGVTSERGDDIIEIVKGSDLYGEGKDEIYDKNSFTDVIQEIKDIYDVNLKWDDFKKAWTIDRYIYNQQIPLIEVVDFVDDNKKQESKSNEKYDTKYKYVTINNRRLYLIYQLLCCVMNGPTEDLKVKGLPKNRCWYLGRQSVCHAMEDWKHTWRKIGRWGGTKVNEINFWVPVIIHKADNDDNDVPPEYLTTTSLYKCKTHDKYRTYTKRQRTLCKKKNPDDKEGKDTDKWDYFLNDRFYLQPSFNLKINYRGSELLPASGETMLPQKEIECEKNEYKRSTVQGPGPATVSTYEQLVESIFGKKYGEKKSGDFGQLKPFVKGLGGEYAHELVITLPNQKWLKAQAQPDDESSDGATSDGETSDTLKVQAQPAVESSDVVFVENDMTQADVNTVGGKRKTKKTRRRVKKKKRTRRKKKLKKQKKTKKKNKKKRKNRKTMIKK